MILSYLLTYLFVVIKQNLILFGMFMSDVYIDYESVTMTSDL